MRLRIGQGWDIHCLKAGRRLMLGGVDIPHHLGLDGHSDADVLLHALIDALLGAAGLGDIGRLFPDTDARFKDANSRMLLKEAWARVSQQGWSLVNVDATIIAQKPKLAPHMPLIIETIAADLQVECGLINVKAKTSEGVDAVGREEAISAYVVLLLQRN